MARNIWEGLGAGLIGAGNAVGSAIASMPTKEEKELMRLKLLAGQQDLETGKQGMDLNALKMKQAQFESEQAAQAAEARKADLAELGRIGSLVDYSKQGLSGNRTIPMAADSAMFDTIAQMGKKEDPQAGGMSLPSESPLAKQSPLSVARSSSRLLSSVQPEAKEFLSNLQTEEKEKGLVSEREQFDYKKKADELDRAMKKQAIEADFMKANMKNKGDVAKSEMDLSDRYNKDNRKKTFEEIKRNSAQMEAAWNAYQSGDKKSLGAVDQALITLFNKMLDPGSVVRESEYARTPENMAYIDSMAAKLEKFKKGGAGLDDAFRKELLSVSQTLTNAAEEGFSKVINDYIENATAWEMNPQRIVGSDYAIVNKYKTQSAIKPEDKSKLDAIWGN